MSEAASKLLDRFQQVPAASGPAPSGTYRRTAVNAVPHFESVAGHFAALAQRKRTELVGCSTIVRGLSEVLAPLSLTRQMRGVVANLVKHVDMFADLGRRYGSSRERGTHQSVAKHGLYELARENFVRGCLSGAVQAVMAEYQAEAASDDAVRATYREIAADERMHNELAWEIAAWLEPQLAEGQALQLNDVKRVAVSRARSQLERAAPAELQYFVGLPSVCDASDLFETLVAERFSEVEFDPRA